jgi:hypothetical protein
MEERRLQRRVNRVLLGTQACKARSFTAESDALTRIFFKLHHYRWNSRAITFVETAGVLRLQRYFAFAKYLLRSG